MVILNHESIEQALRDFDCQSVRNAGIFAAAHARPESACRRADDNDGCVPSLTKSTGKTIFRRGVETHSKPQQNGENPPQSQIGTLVQRLAKI